MVGCLKVPRTLVINRERGREGERGIEREREGERGRERDREGERGRERERWKKQ